VSAAGLITGSAFGDAIVVRGLRLWAHVGVLPFEREFGQWFELDLDLCLDLSSAGVSDHLADSLDYAQLIAALQQQARSICCLTIERYAECVLRLIATEFGPFPVVLELRKCDAPVPGFTGVVAVRRCGPPSSSAG
jgi:7,8-dihydroneopterin aldolase/epimerase/oxygenase